MSKRLSPMHIVHIISGIDASLGGPVVSMVGLVRAQVDCGLKVTVAFNVGSGELPPTVTLLKQAGAEVLTLGASELRPNWNSTIDQQLGPLIQACDVVHIHALWEEIQHQAALLSRKFNKPYLFRPCGMLDRWALKRKWLKKQLYLFARLGKDLNRAAAFHADSTWEGDQIKALGYKPPIIVGANGIELGEFESLPARGEFRRKYPALENRPVIVFLGRIFPGKGLEMLIPALAKMQTKSAMLAIVGPDLTNFKPQVEAWVAEHQMQDRVVFTGMARGRDRIAALVDADVFSLPSEHENFGVAVLEAMAAGAPVIVSDQVGLCNEIAEARAGQAVPLDPAKLAKALDEWLADPARCREAGQRGRAIVFERFTWPRIAQQWVEHYQRLVR